MSLTIFGAIFASAFIQASWNFFAKKTKANKSALLFVGWLMLGLVITPIAAIFTDFSDFSFFSLQLIALSGLIHVVYVLALGWAYTVGDLSVVYPIARGLGIALTSVLAFLLGFDDISRFGAVGVCAIVFGVMLIGLREWSGKKNSILPAVVVAIIVSSYSLVDSRGVEYVPVFFFAAVMNLSTSLLALPFLVTKLKAPSIEVLKNHKKEAFLVAAGGTSSYVIILWAFTKTDTTYVVALREFSVVIASVLGFIFLKEKVYLQKLVALVFIVLGMILIKVFG